MPWSDIKTARTNLRAVFGSSAVEEKENTVMHKGVFVGIRAEQQEKRILILGESHHINKKDKGNSEAGKEATYPTCRVVAEYFEDTEKKNKNLRFFEKIARSFGISVPLDEEADAFWNKVYFGNYIPVLCGVGTDTAEKMIQDHRQEYNDALFSFLNSNKIDVVCCFGRRTFDALPSLYSKDEDRGRIITGISVGGKTDYISGCVYHADVQHKNTTVILNRNVEVYCMRHPSARGGYCADNYVPFLRTLIEKQKI